MSETPETRTTILGLVGGVASGKSTAGALLAGPEGQVVDADALAHEILASKEVTRLVVEHFGEGLLGEDGRPDRKALGALAFAPETGDRVRSLLEDWIHPRVRARISELLGDAQAAGVPRVVLDIPLLLESAGLAPILARCDAVLFVDTPREDRERRARENRGWSAGEVARREAEQMPLDQKRRLADHVIPNNGSLEELKRAVAKTLSEIATD